jgi:hypothetical protein
MMSFLLGLHKVAALRGEGLRPEFLRLLEHSIADQGAPRRAPEIAPALPAERKNQPMLEAVPDASAEQS